MPGDPYNTIKQNLCIKKKGGGKHLVIPRPILFCVRHFFSVNPLAKGSITLQKNYFHVAAVFEDKSGTLPASSIFRQVQLYADNRAVRTLD
jgi:hypothetical protein